MRRNFAPRTVRTAVHAVSPEYAQPACGRTRTFGFSPDFASPHAVSHFLARARISRSVPGYHVPAIVLPSAMVRLSP